MSIENKESKNVGGWKMEGRSMWGGGENSLSRRQFIAGFFIGMAFGLAIGIML